MYYFPLREQLKRLIELPAYRELLLHEVNRSRPRRRRSHLRRGYIMTDVYDSPRWREIIGEPTRTLTRIVLQICVDGMPVYNRKETLSVKMVQYFMMSLPPWLRYKTQHMLLHMFFPSSFKAKESSKRSLWDSCSLDYY